MDVKYPDNVHYSVLPITTHRPILTWAHCLFLREWFHRLRKSTGLSNDRGECGLIKVKFMKNQKNHEYVLYWSWLCPATALIEC